MKFAAFNVSEYEKEHFEKINSIYHLDMDYYYENQSYDFDNIDLSIYDGISLISLEKIPNEFIDKLKKCKVIGLRSIGFQYIDLDHCKKKNIVVTNAKYNPYNVADFTIMLMLMCCRKIKEVIDNSYKLDFSINNLCGKEMHNIKIGIIGTGKIGSTVIKQLRGFNSSIYCYDLYQNEEIKDYATYVDLDYIYHNCDLISIHMPLTKDNYHMINKESIHKMKDGVILINTARGAIIDTDALIEGLNSKKIFAAGIDTIEEETEVAHFSNVVVDDSAKEKIVYLTKLPNVIYSPHIAFFTKEAVYSMVESSIKALVEYKNDQEIENKVN